MTLEEMLIAIYKSTEDDFQNEFSTKMNPVDYANAKTKFNNIHEELFGFLYSLKPIVTESSDPMLVELVDDMDKFLEMDDKGLLE